MEPIERVLRVINAHHRGAALDPAESEFVIRWLSEGIKRHLRNAEPIDKALGFVGGQGQRSARTWYLTAERDHHLSQAWHALDRDTSWGKSVVLAERIRRFESTVWPRWRRLAQPPAADPVRRHLFAAFQTGLRIPQTAERLHSICSPD